MRNPAAWIVGYFKGVGAETRKVIWPSLPVLVQHLVGVIVGLIVFTAFVAGVDYVFIHALAFLVNK